jgi:DNA-binding MurR/RpiR family transcriptional regulator
VKDVLVVFDYRRYEEPTFALARYAARRRAKIVLFTDGWLSPVSSTAEVVLPSETGAPSPYDAMAPALALVEAVVAGVLGALGESAHTRMGRTEEVAGELSLF